jgi:hypothetical protein
LGPPTGVGGIQSDPVDAERTASSLADERPLFLTDGHGEVLEQQAGRNGGTATFIGLHPLDLTIVVQAHGAHLRAQHGDGVEEERVTGHETKLGRPVCVHLHGPETIIAHELLPVGIEIDVRLLPEDVPLFRLLVGVRQDDGISRPGEQIEHERRGQQQAEISCIRDMIPPDQAVEAGPLEDVIRRRIVFPSLFDKKLQGLGVSDSVHCLLQEWSSCRTGLMEGTTQARAQVLLYIIQFF